MLKRIPGAPEEVHALEVIGTLTREDYEDTIEPMLNEARRDNRHLRLLVWLGPEYRGFTAGALREKLTAAAKSVPAVKLIDGYALVTDVQRLRKWIQPMRFFAPFPLRIFSNTQYDDAVAWLGSLPEKPCVTHRMIAEQGVVLVEVTEPLRAQDFDAIGTTVDTWLENRDILPGIVLHISKFHGWENVNGLLRHIRFVRDHHRLIRRVALATDVKGAALAPRLVSPFVRAEMRRFTSGELDEALAWAAQTPAENKSSTIDMHSSGRRERTNAPESGAAH